ncbi:hypothetical protein AVEN_245159-1 [Araneus ventricosus]|uniref:Uncharacterized protein n=1 Tax=Araneus ventricosus TaxID=182803 RepID=A0A4Y2MBV0_ARAVE|nr:hypothetical protein AVEN_245159-1 [Araneus ventricosus]
MLEQVLRQSRLPDLEWGLPLDLGLEKRICISVRGSQMLDFEVIFLQSLISSYLAFRFPKIQKPSKGYMISPEKIYVHSSDGNAL